jgi:hypothetical protein
MIPFEELDRALVRWKTRVQGGAGAPSEPVPSEISVDADATPLPMSAEDVLSGIPEPASPSPGSTREVDLDQVESSEDRP